MLRASQIFEIVAIGVRSIGMGSIGKRLSIAIGSIAIGLSACSAPEPPAKDSQLPDDQPQPTVFSDTVGTLDRARAVQETSDQHARDLEQAQREAEGR